MSEQQNLDIVRQGYEAFGRGDLEALLDLMDPQVTFTTPGPAELPTAGTRRGRDGVRQFFETLPSVVDIKRFEPKEFLAQGDRVVVIGDDTSVAKATGAMIEGRWVHIFTVRSGKIVMFEERMDVSPLVAELRSAQARA